MTPRLPFLLRRVGVFGRVTANSLDRREVTTTVVVSLVAILSLWCLFLSPALAASGDDWRVRGDKAHVHEAPDRQSPVAVTLGLGNRVKELRRQGAWIKVLVFDKIGVEGWIDEADIEPLRRHEPEGEAIATEQDDVAATKTPKPRFTLSLSGTRQRFRAQCMTYSSEGARTERRFRGTVPAGIGIHASAVHCKVDRLDQRAGRLFVKLFERGRTLPLGANSTNGAFGCVRVRSDGPWGRAYARRCSRVAIY